LKDDANETDDVKAAAEVERLLERLIGRYGAVQSDGTTLADLARPELDELRRLSVGKIAPEIEEQDLDGQKLRLSDYRGKVVVLTFWGTWCGPCMAMVPDERKLVERYAAKPFAIVGVNSDSDPV
jgi:thiol-disulfide isomerase/thioredoxin